MGDLGTHGPPDSAGCVEAGYTLASWQGLAAGSGLLLLLAAIVLLPGAQYPALSAADLHRVASVATRVDLQNARYTLQNDYRGQLIQVLAALIVVAGAVATWQQIRIAREGQITERFTRAIDHLGSDKLDVRLGSIYALERIALNSPADRASVTRILTAFVREHPHGSSGPRMGPRTQPPKSMTSCRGYPTGPTMSKALQTLFGLTGSSRGKTWRTRQEIAARALSVTWDYFRHDLQEELLRSVAEQILIATRDNNPPSAVDRPPGLWAFATQNDIESLTLDYIRERRPSSAAMLEFSTATTGSILRALRDVQATIHLLAANPERVTGWHEARMRRSLTDLLNIDFDGYEQLRMRLYSIPPSLRGRSIGDLIVLGWYTHRDNKRIDAFDPASVEVWGHDNAVVMGRSGEADGTVLANWFSREFQRLWNHRSTLDEITSARIIRIQD